METNSKQDLTNVNNFSSINYTFDQSKVLDDDSFRLLVSASAGSGKTATIIEKITRLILSGKDLQKMLIITFTESASQEMKSRLKDNLKVGASSDKNLREQLEKLPLADISTLHSFCSKMIRKYFYYLNLKPNFIVLDELSSKFLKVRALEKTIKYYAKNNDGDFINLSTIFGGGRNFESLKSSILNLYDFLCGVDDKEKFINEIATICYNTDLENNSACQYLNKYMCENFSYLLKSLKNYEIKALQEKALFFAEFINNVITKIQLVKKDNSFIDNQQIITNLVLPRLTNKKLSNEDSLYKEFFKPFWNSLQERIKDIKKFITDRSKEEIINDLTNAKEFLNKFIQVENAFEQYYFELKEKRNGLDFNDLEKQFLKLLSYEEVRNNINYDYIFVDEYQDINCVQEKILSYLSNSSKMIMVGDIKQSIYGFRNSTPEIFSAKLKSYFENSQNGTLISLNENFRSNPIILEFVNSIFIKCMSDDFGGVDYEKIGQLKGESEYKSVSNIPIIEVDILDKTKDDDNSSCQVFDKVYSVNNDKNEYEQTLSESRKEALIVVDKISRLVNNFYYDAKSKESKKIKFSDIAILSRSNDFLKEIAKVLIEFRIPIATDLIDNLYKNQDVILLFSILKLVNNLHDDEALSVVLSSYFFNISFDELAKIRLNFNDEKYFYNCVKRYYKECLFDKNLSNKLKYFFEFISYLQNCLLYMSIYEILNLVCDKFDYFDYLCSLPDGFNRVKLVKDYIDGFVGVDYNYDLVGYIDFVDSYAFNSKFRASFVGGTESVKLGTIHSSKGLEYPIVFVVGCGNAFSLKTFKEDILKDKDYGLGIHSYDLIKYEKTPNLARNMITLYKRRQERAEELRLLYVALTRAKNHLFMIGECSLSNLEHITSPFDAMGANNYLSLILSSLSSINFMNLVKNKKDITQKITTKKFTGVTEYKIYTDDFFVSKESNQVKLNLKNIDEKIIRNLKNIIEYKFEKTENIALKNSVSSLLKEAVQGIESFNYTPKKLSVFEGQVESNFYSKLGTIYHNIMEQVDFKKDFNQKVYDEILTKLNVEEKYLKEINYDKISLCVNTIKELGLTSFKKEVPFISYVPYSEIFDSPIKDKVIVQGVADLLVESKDKHFLVDYKTTKTNTEKELIDKYKVQLMLYKLCLEKASNIRFDSVYIYSFYYGKILKVF